MLADQWFVVQTNPQKESFVEQRLKDLRVYFPRFKKISGRIAPLFPRYIFTPKIAEVRLITSTIGVRGLLMAGDHPATIKGSVIAFWKAKERGGLVQLPPPPRFQIGETLTILRGSLKWRTVIYAGMRGKDREKVLIEMLGGQVSLTVPTQDLASDFRPPTRNRLRSPRETLSGQGRRSFSAAHCRSF
jgi:transcription antitermination factor NusG